MAVGIWNHVKALTGRMTKPIRDAVNNNDTWGGVAHDLVGAKEEGLFTFGIQHKIRGKDGKVAQRAVSADSTYGQTLLKDSEKYENRNGVVFSKDKNKMMMEDATERRLYDGRKVAGAAAVLPVGYRFLSGGGVYRDKDGNVDWVGVPFF